MVAITALHAREIIDSRGNPTVEADITLADGSFGRAAVPAGASVGSHEAKELRDKDVTRYAGRGVLTAVGNVNGELRQALVGQDVEQSDLDKKMIALDGTLAKERLGANALLSVSLAFAHAAAASRKIPLYEYFAQLHGVEARRMPVPLANILNGGRHAESAADFQEFEVIPFGAPTFAEGARYCAEIFHELQRVLVHRGLNANYGDEGGYAPSLPFNELALELLVSAIEAAGFKPGEDVGLGIDVAANELFHDGAYHLHTERKALSSKDLEERYVAWSKKYPLVSIEDPFAEDDWNAVQSLTAALGGQAQVVGDDLFCTNKERLEHGITLKAGNAIIIKPNQIGTVTETMNVIALAQSNGYRTIISHRSGETEDTTIAHWAVGVGSPQIKTGSLSRGERTAKYNELLRIEERLDGRAQYWGREAFGK